MKNYLIIMAGLPGTGKTTTAEKLAEKLGYKFLSQNDVRREYGMTEMPTSQPNILRDVERRISKMLGNGDGVVLDAAHRYGGRRHQLYGVASGLGRGVIVVETTCREETAKKRMTERPDSDGLLADARDPAIYDKVAAGWEPVADDLMDFSNHVTHLVYNTEDKSIEVPVMGDDSEEIIKAIKKALE